MRRRFSVAAAALALSAALTVPAYAGTWKYVNDQWKYQRGTNKFAYNEWIKDNGKYYYIGNDGIMKTGWQQVNNQWYYMDQTGVMQTGWFKDTDGNGISCIQWCYGCKHSDRWQDHWSRWCVGSK